MSTATVDIADHQPLAIPEDGRFRPGCICDWRGVQAYDHRTEAMVMARALHDDRLEATCAASCTP